MSRYRFLLRERLTNFREWIDKRNPRRFELVLLICLVVGLTATIWSEYLPALHSFSRGTPASRTVVADKTVTVLDAAATGDLKAHVASLVEPVYTADPQALSKATAELETFLHEAERLRQSVAEGVSVAAAQVELEQSAPSTASAVTVELLLTADEATFSQVENQSLGALKTLYGGRITEGAIDSARATLRSIADALAVSNVTADAVYEVAAGYLEPNQVVDQEETLARREAAMEQVAPIVMTVDGGEQVVQEGEPVTGQDMLILGALGLTQQRSGRQVWVGSFLLVLLEAAVFSRLVGRFNKGVPGFGNNMLLALVILLLAATLVARLLIIHPLSAYVIPVAALGMAVAVILNSRTALLMVALTSLNIGLLTDLNMRYAVVALLVGSLSLYLVSRVAKRAALLGAGLATMMLAAFTIFCVELFTKTPLGDALTMSVWGLANGLLSGMLAVIALMILETVFNLTTPLRLLELADPAHPLLKKLLQVAPGPYNHSIQLGNLAEAAAEAIGADSLLARVGAYYHDVGKTVRPEYFVENQIYVDNPHNRLSPSLSKLAITAHVRDGEHLGRMYGLPQPVVDIIKQHHGTSVVAFFYHKARESSKEPVYEDDYRYEEQKPRSKEAAIIMLADGVEAAVRAMENPTRRKLQGVIQEIVKQRVQDGQLDESDLTQNDLRKIRDSFDVSLLGLLGHRVRYPDQDDQGGRRLPRGPGAGRQARPSGPGASRTASGSTGAATEPSRKGDTGDGG